MSGSATDVETLTYLVEEIAALRQQLSEHMGAHKKDVSGLKEELAGLKENDHFEFPTSVLPEFEHREQPQVGEEGSKQGMGRNMSRGMSVNSTYSAGDETLTSQQRMHRSTVTAVDDTAEVYELPTDVFTMFFFAHYRSLSFVYAVTVYSLQLLSLSIITYDLLDDDLRLGDDDGNRFNVPIQVEWQVQVARCIAILISVISRDDCLDTFRIVTIGFKSRWKRKFPGATMTQFILMNLMRFSEGAFVIFISFIFIVQSDNVLDLFLNFAAIEFISSLDNLAYELAEDGWLSRSMQLLTDLISETKIYLNFKDKEKLRKKQYLKHILMICLLVGLYTGFFLILEAERKGVLLESTACSHMRFEFGEQQYSFSADAPDFNGFDYDTRKTPVFGNYSIDLRTLVGSDRPLGPDMNLDQPDPLIYSTFSNDYIARPNARIFDRYVYDENGYDDITSGMFYYCENELAWVFTIRALAYSGAVPQATIDRCGEDGWLLRSEETSAFSLDEVSKEGWKIWTGTLVDAVGIKIFCANCNSDIDCGIARGSCSSDEVCECEEGFTGSFCDREEACDAIANYFEGGVDILESFEILPGFELLAYDRPIYRLKVPHSSTPVSPLDRPDELLMYNGRRWMVIKITGADLAIFSEGLTTISHELFEERFSRQFHAYWSDIGGNKIKRISEETDNQVPTGDVEWYTFGLTKSKGDYGLYGHTLPYKQGFECLSVNCNVLNLCGIKGECKEVESIVLFANTTDTGSEGNQCVCTEPSVTGHYCEYANSVSWDENGTITHGPFQLDPYLAACYGPHKDLPDCLEKLYPEFVP